MIDEKANYYKTLENMSMQSLEETELEKKLNYFPKQEDEKILELAPKPIIISVKNQRKIQEKIDEIQQGCKQRTVDFKDVASLAVKAMDKLESINASQASWEFCRFSYRERVVSNSYGYKYQTTAIEIIYEKKKFRLLSIKRESHWPSNTIYNEYEFLPSRKLCENILKGVLEFD